MNLKLERGYRYRCRVVARGSSLTLHDLAPGARRAMLRLCFGFPAAAWLVVAIMAWYADGIDPGLWPGFALLGTGTAWAAVMGVYVCRMPTESRTLRIDAKRREQRLRVHEGNGPKGITRPMAFRPAEELSVHPFERGRVRAIVLLHARNYPFVIGTFRQPQQAEEYAESVRVELRRLGGPV